mgnify:CR=1 FL=1|jgi:hypothetical protein
MHARFNAKFTCCPECSNVWLLPAFVKDSDVRWKLCPKCRARKRAFYAVFWGKYVKAMQNGDLTEDGLMVARIDGEHYVIGPENTVGFRGFSGRRFVIRFTVGPHAGEIVETTNLWHQGTISHGYEKILHDNAVFVPQEYPSLISVS